MRRLSLARAGTVMTLALLVAGASACSTSVTRMSPDQAMDLSGRWNDVDSRLVADALIEQSFAQVNGANWVTRHARARGGERPALIVGTVRNRSMEHIPVNTFVRDLERAFVQSGQVRVVARSDEREEVRDERYDQQQHAAADSRARLGRELGASYILQGEIQSIEDREGRRRVVFYQIDLNLVNLETNERSWVGQHKIKKYVQQPRLRI